jgi:hypothetical protein
VKSSFYIKLSVDDIVLTSPNNVEIKRFCTSNSGITSDIVNNSFFMFLGIDTIYANDIDAGAVESIKQNIELNGVTNLVQASEDDAMNLLYSHRKTEDQFHVVDLDPYGTPAQFLGKYYSLFSFSQYKFQ